MKVTPGTVKARTIAINQPPTEDECTCGCRQVKTTAGIFKETDEATGYDTDMEPMFEDGPWDTRF